MTYKTFWNDFTQYFLYENLTKDQFTLMKEFQIDMFSDPTKYSDINNEKVSIDEKELEEHLKVNNHDSDLLAFFPEDLGSLEIEAEKILGINPGDT